MLNHFLIRNVDFLKDAIRGCRIYRSNLSQFPEIDVTIVSMRSRLFFFTLSFSIVLSACAMATPSETQVPTLEPSSTPIIFPTGTPTALPTSTGTSTPTPTPTHTTTPTPTLYVLQGTPLPPPPAQIVVENAAQVSALAEWRETAVVDMTWTSDGLMLAVANQETINLYDVSSRQNLRTLYPRAKELVEIVFSPNGRWLVAGSRRGSIEEGFYSTLELWVGPDWKPLGILYDVPLALSRLAFSPDGATLAMAFTSPVYEDNIVEFLSTINWQIVGDLPTGTALDVIFLPGGGRLAVTPDRYAVRVRDFNEEEWIFTQHTSFTGAITRMAFSPDAVTLATAHYDGEIRLWNVDTSELLLVINTDEVVENIDFSPDGQILASGGSFQNQFVRLWDVGSGALLRTLEGHTSGVTHVLFSPDGKYLVSGSYDGQLRLWGIR